MAAITQTNEELKAELWGRGYYVNEVKRGDKIDYLVVTTEPPLDLMPIEDNSN
jgi:hypothetical protein